MAAAAAHICQTALHTHRPKNCSARVAREDFGKTPINSRSSVLSSYFSFPMMSSGDVVV